MSVGKIVCCILGVICFIGGIYCVITPAETYMALGWLIGAFMLIEGVGSIIAWADKRKQGNPEWITLAGAIISVILGIITLCSMGMQMAFDLLIAYLAALWMIFNGICRCLASFEMRKLTINYTGTSWIFTLIIGILLIIVGIIGFCNPIIVMAAYGLIIGISIIFIGISLLGIALA